MNVGWCMNDSDGGGMFEILKEKSRLTVKTVFPG